TIGAATIHPGHSHNDYEQNRPLKEALENRFYSVEADIWYGKDKIQVSHTGWFYQGELEELYLNPLQDRVRAFGSMYGDARPFLLWLDIKDQNPGLVSALDRLLSRYSMLTRIVDEKVFPGPVSVILTGDESQKRNYVEKYTTLYASRDSTRF